MLVLKHFYMLKRIVREEGELEDAFHRAKSEAEKSFGNSEVYIERYIDNPKHIKYKLLGMNMVILFHLYERDCSVQRRHQKGSSVQLAYQRITRTNL